MCLFLCQYRAVLMTIALQHSLTSGSVTPPGLFFFRIALTIQGPFWVHLDFRIVASISVKNAIGLLVWIALNLWMALGIMDILTI